MGAHFQAGKVFVLPTPIRIGVLASWLSIYPNRDDAALLLNGFSKGFSLQYGGPRIRRDSHCLLSAVQHPNIVKRKLAEELSLGRVAGPFVDRPLPNLQCSPIGLVPKHEPNSFRLIHHLSFPHGGSINDFIDREQCQVHYASFDKAVSIAVSAGHGAWLAKSDIKSAFRLLPVSPEDYELLGFSFDGSFYYDRCLPMGCSISCALFEKFSTLLEFRVKFVTKSSSVTHYLDDFLFVGSSRSSCSTLLNTFTTICEELGVPLAHEKTEGPSQTITFLGLETRDSCTRRKGTKNMRTKPADIESG